MRFADAVVPVEWATETMVQAEFRGERTEAAPLTWAQQMMWRVAARSGSQHRFLNLRRTMPVSQRVRADLTGATRAVGALVSRHGALRTRVRPIDGEPSQETAAAGRLPLLVAEGEGDGAATAQELADRFGDVAFDHAAEWPLRVALVLVDGWVRQVVIVFSHSTVDAYATEVILKDLRLLLLRGVLNTPVGPQSVEVARRQHGVDQRRSERAVEYWVREFGRLPPESLEPTWPELDPRLRRGVLVSSAVDTAARLIAARHRVSASAVLLAGTTAVATAGTGRDACGLFTMAHNRFRAGYDGAVANLGQIGFCVLDLTGRPSFGELLARVWRASLEGYRHSYYDPARLRQGFEDQGYEYPEVFLPHFYFNDVRLPGDVDADGPAAVTEPALRAAAQRSTFAWTRGLERSSWRQLTHVVDEPGGVGITLSVDTRFQPPEAAEPSLRGLEALLVEAAFREVAWPWSPAASRPNG